MYMALCQDKIDKCHSERSEEFAVAMGQARFLGRFAPPEGQFIIMLT